MNYDALVQLVTILGIISVTAERSTEMIINFLQLDAKFANDKIKSGVYHVLTAMHGALIYLFNTAQQSAFIDQYFTPFMAPIVIGLLVSAGSSFWHDILKKISGLAPKNETPKPSTSS